MEEEKPLFCLRELGCTWCMGQGQGQRGGKTVVAESTHARQTPQGMYGAPKKPTAVLQSGAAARSDPNGSSRSMVSAKGMINPGMFEEAAPLHKGIYVSDPILQSYVSD